MCFCSHDQPAATIHLVSFEQSSLQQLSTGRSHFTAAVEVGAVVGPPPLHAAREKLKTRCCSGAGAPSALAAVPRSAAHASGSGHAAGACPPAPAAAACKHAGANGIVTCSQTEQLWHWAGQRVPGCSVSRLQAHAQHMPGSCCSTRAAACWWSEAHTHFICRLEQS